VGLERGPVHGLDALISAISDGGAMELAGREFRTGDNEPSGTGLECRHNTAISGRFRRYFCGRGLMIAAEAGAGAPSVDALGFLAD
jgi:hypothetical protein